MINQGYILGQLARALASSAGVEARAEKIHKWEQGLAGVRQGSLAVGSRTPVAGAPAWATLEVATGGFATGQLLAGGALQPHEVQLGQRLLGPHEPAETRAALNLFYLGDAGRAELLEALRSGDYRIEVPEEAALLVVAWLLARGDADGADRILGAIMPFVDRLRFYPVPFPRTSATHASDEIGGTVRLRPASQTAQALLATRQQPQVLAMNEALTLWTPLFDRAVALFAETERDGWPCRVYPPGWPDRARGLVAEYARLRATHTRSGKPDAKKGNFARLRGYLEIAAESPEALTGRDVGMIRKILASSAARHGALGSDRLAQLRAVQQQAASRPTHGALRQLVAERLAQWPPGEGLATLDAVTASVTAGEAASLGVDAATPIPPSVTRKVRGSLEAPVEELVRQGVIRSAEVLGAVLPQVTSQIHAASIADPALRRLCARAYAAFRRRRSLLLVDLQHQVRLNELPWIAAMTGQQRDQEHRGAPLSALHDLSRLTLRAFPQTILPNKVLTEFGALAQAAQLQLPLVEELAVDIFMGAFSEKFVRAAQVAATLLQGTLYERYYGLPYEEVLRIDDVGTHPHQTRTSPAFAALCARLAGPRTGARSSTAAAGKMIEQQQVLTTHNLATLVSATALRDELRVDVLGLAQRGFTWLCRVQQRGRTPWRTRLRTVKNAAYAWRQMIFFLSLDQDSLRAFLPWADELLASQRAPFQARFAPALRGLRFVAAGGHFDDQGASPDGGRRFLGWTTETHWALADT